MCGLPVMRTIQREPSSVQVISWSPFGRMRFLLLIFRVTPSLQTIGQERQGVLLMSRGIYATAPYDSSTTPRFKAALIVMAMPRMRAASAFGRTEFAQTVTMRAASASRIWEP
jgi:hypothetical protein